MIFEHLIQKGLFLLITRSRVLPATVDPEQPSLAQKLTNPGQGHFPDGYSIPLHSIGQ